MSNASDNLPTADQLGAAVEALQAERDELRQRLEEIGRHEGAAYISRRPAWAAETHIDGESITYRWTTPTVAKTVDYDGEHHEVEVQILRTDDLFAFPDGVTLETGVPSIFVLDTEIDDVAEARKLAAAIVEACDRLDELGDDAR